MNSPAALVRAFHRKMGQPVRVLPVWPDKKEREFRATCAIDEALEFVEAADNDLLDGYDSATDEDVQQAIADVAGELADIVYVAYGAALYWGINLDRCIEAIHEANMRKTGGPKGEDGKQLKPEGWEAAELLPILFPPYGSRP